MTYFVYLNGPPKSGKDTIANLLAEKYENVKVAKFAQILRDAMQEIFGIDEAFYEAEKDRHGMIRAWSDSEGCSLTYREFVIRLSERVLKPNFGAGNFGVALAENIKANAIHLPLDTVYIISDSGFSDELIAFRERVPGVDEILIHLYRDGCNFDNDSRNYVSDVIVPAPVYNNDTIERGVREVESRIEDMLIQYSDTLRYSK